MTQTAIRGEKEAQKVGMDVQDVKEVIAVKKETVLKLFIVKFKESF